MATTEKRLDMFQSLRVYICTSYKKHENETPKYMALITIKNTPLKKIIIVYDTHTDTIFPTDLELDHILNGFRPNPEDFQGKEKERETKRGQINCPLFLFLFLPKKLAMEMPCLESMIIGLESDKTYELFSFIVVNIFIDILIVIWYNIYRKYERFKNTMTFQEYCLDELGYKTLTTYWDDFSIAERFGIKAIADTFREAVNEHYQNYKILTELVLILNHKIWYYYDKNERLAKLYNNLWETLDQWCCNHLKGEELSYYYRVLD